MSTKVLRTVGLLEGLSSIALFFVAMPMRYMFDNPSFIFPAGMTHGILFLIFLVTLLLTSHKQGWAITMFLLGLFAAIIPCGTFLFDWKIKKMEEA